MPRKIMFINGSPRKDGCTRTLCDWAAEGARERDADVEIVDACDLNLKAVGCTACKGCQRSDEYLCVIKDDVREVLESLQNRDVLVLASPVFFMGFSAQIKAVIDRMYSLIKFGPGGQPVSPTMTRLSYGLIGVGGGDERGGIKMLEANMDAITRFVGKEARKLLVPSAPQNPADIVGDEELRIKAHAFGRDFA